MDKKSSAKRKNMAFDWRPYELLRPKPWHLANSAAAAAVFSKTAPVRIVKEELANDVAYFLARGMLE